MKKKHVQERKGKENGLYKGPSRTSGKIIGYNEMRVDGKI
jgi:hypothetical protein